VKQIDSRPPHRSKLEPVIPPSKSQHQLVEVPHDLEMEVKEKEHKHKNRLKSLFSKEKKPPPEADVNDFLRSPSDDLYFEAPTPPATSSQEVDEFLHGPSDKLNFAMPAPASASHPPALTRIDTSSARRWPSAAEVRSSSKPRGRSTSPKRSKKGLMVRFTDKQPEVIGEGGDEAELPTISLRLRAHSHPPGRPRSREPPPRTYGDVPPPAYTQTAVEESGTTENFRPGLLRRAPTGFESHSDIHNVSSQQAPPLPEEEPERYSKKGHPKTDSHGPTSFAARVQAEMRAGEGMALLAASHPSKADDEGSLMDESPETPAVSSKTPGFPEQINAGCNPDKAANTDMTKARDGPLVKLELPDYSPLNLTGQLSALSIVTSQSKHILPPSPSNAQQVSPAPSIPPQLSPGSRPLSQGNQEIRSAATNENPMPISRTSTLTLNDAAVAVGDDALQEFSTRVAHLFNIFLLSAESRIPLSKCSLEDFVRAALWWFLKGRLQLESTIRDRPATPEAQQTNFLTRQQAYADLSKALWIIETITPSFPEVSSQQKDSQQKDPHVIDILETRKSTMSSLRKLTMSMKRNNFLPPDEATLPQGLNTSIWIQDGGNRSLLSSQKQAVLPNLNDYFPLGDTNRNFHYGRAFAGATLIEDADSQSEEYYTPVLISIIRGHHQTALTAVIASQDGMLKVCVQGDKSLGPTWENVTWVSKSNHLDIRLPRGFLLRVQCSYQDFRTLRGIFDYQKKTHGGLVRQQDEELVFETFLKAFQYFDPDPTSTFPKDILNNCRLRLFEKVHVQKAASGTRGMHRGFRIGLVTSPNTKNLRGINQDLPPTLPIQFGFLRGGGGLPALLLRIHDEKSKYTVVLTFEDVNERTQLHARFTGISLGDREAIVMEAEAKAFSVANLDQPTEDDGALKALDWQSIRVINEEQVEPQAPKTVLSTSLRVVMDFRGGSITDRVNIGPGELKVRLDVNDSNQLKVLRQPQQDMTVSISESQVPKDLPNKMNELLATIAASETSRTYTFPSHQELHLFQAALTGFSVLFDGMASSFNISRRRMVVPIYKKLDAATTRLQLVQREKVVQLVAFFENFSHGECMNFALKSTDVFESAGRHGKQMLRIVDAKFAMPKARAAGNDAGFVCLDMPEYPGEHDDITIVFDNESGMSNEPPKDPKSANARRSGTWAKFWLDYEKFTKALPAPVKAASRMPSVRR
jgi:hypothetical protein